MPGLRAPGFPLRTSADFDRYYRSLRIEPSPDTVGETQLQDASVIEAKLAAAAVSANKIAADAVTATKIAAEAVTAAKLAAEAVTAAKLATDAVTTPKIQALAVTTEKLENANADGKVLIRRAGVMVYDALAISDVVNLTSGVYTPTLTNVANLDGSTAYQCQYLRVGSVITVSGKVDVNPTAGAATRLGISLPVASNLADAQDCAGTAFAPGIAGQGAAILGDTTNDRAQMEWIAADTTNQPMYFQFQYRVI